MNDKLVSLSIIAATAAAYSISTEMKYAEAFVFSVVGGALGYPIFYVIDRFVLKGIYINTSAWLKYAISIAIISAIGIPFQQNLKGRQAAEKELEFTIGDSIGKIILSCKIYQNSMKKYCPSQKINLTISSLCSEQLYVPHKMRDEVNKIYASQRFLATIQEAETTLEASYNSARQLAEFNNDTYCQALELLLSETIVNNSSKLQQIKK